MQKTLFSFIKDEKDMTEAIGANEKDMMTAAIYAKSIINKIKMIVSLNEDKNIYDILFSEKINKEIINMIKQLNISLKHKFIIITMSIYNTPQIEKWYIIALKLNKKISWEQYWIKFLELGEIVINQFMFDMFIEIYLSLFNSKNGSIDEIEIYM